MIRTIGIVTVLFFIPIASFAQSKTEIDSLIISKYTDDSRIVFDSTIALPTSYYQTISDINLNNVDIRAFLNAVAKEHKLNIYIDNRIQKQVTLRFEKITVIELLLFLTDKFDLKFIQNGNIVEIRSFIPKIVKAINQPKISYDSLNSVVNVESVNVNFPLFLDTYSSTVGINIVYDQNINKDITVKLNNIDALNALSLILDSNGFRLNEKKGVYYVSKKFISDSKNNTNQNYWVNVEDSLVSIEAYNTSVDVLLDEITNKSKMKVIKYSKPDAIISANIDSIHIDDCLNFLFKGTDITYRVDSGVYYVGKKDISGIASTQMIRMNHIPADKLLKMVPKSISGNLTLQIVQEQNGVVAIGANDAIYEFKQFVKEVDHPTPQILIEALVIDMEGSNVFELGLDLGIDSDKAGSANSPTKSIFNSEGLSLTGNATSANKASSSIGSLLGVKNIGVLPSDFYYKIKALNQNGRIEIRSRPQISTLNGHKASISIGTTQYYILDTTTPYPQRDNVYTQNSQRFEKIEANVKLEITPWVNSSGEVTAEIVPEFSSPVGEFDPEVPPTINHRVLNSSVRLKDGETIIMGGLIEDRFEEVKNRVPIMYRIPLLGRLFQSVSKKKVKSELIVLLTPYVFYGDESERGKWEELRDKDDLY